MAQGDQLDPLQEAFLDHGAVQCGYCTPGMILSAKALLDAQPDPTEEEVREALAGNFCRCTGYLKAGGGGAGRGAATTTAANGKASRPRRRWRDEHDAPSSARMSARWTASSWSPAARRSPTISTFPECSIGKILPSPHAHARIKRIDTRKAKALPGVHAVLTYKDVPRVPHTTAGQAWPEPSPYDTYLLDSKVRFVGDRVAAVAAESRAIAEEALRLIEVEYEVLPAVLEMEQAMGRRRSGDPRRAGFHQASTTPRTTSPDTF